MEILSMEILSVGQARIYERPGVANYVRTERGYFYCDGLYYYFRWRPVDPEKGFEDALVFEATGRGNQVRTTADENNPFLGWVADCLENLIDMGLLAEPGMDAWDIFSIDGEKADRTGDFGKSARRS